MDTKEKFSGSCRCGYITYLCSGKPAYVNNCHCKDCQKFSGAPYITWAAYKSDNFSISSGKPKSISLNKGIRRSFCGKCGTNLFWESDSHKEWIGITSASFDQKVWKPQSEDYLSSKIEWVKIDENIRHNERGFFED